ncbi:histidinol-phosphate transaminase [Thermodesulfobacteriota bacterium]
MFSARLKRLTPYVPGEQPQDRTYLKLNTNENPYPPSPQIESFLRDFNPEKLRLYPDPQFKRLRDKIAARYGLQREQVFVSNGSDEALSFAFFAFFDSLEGLLLFPEFTYSFYPVYCDYYGIEYQKVPLKSDFSIDIGGFLERKSSCGVIFANPNAPTGICVSPDEIRYLMENYPRDRVVVVDEAYIDFGGTSALGLIEEYRNLLIIRTFSKSMSLAGLRLGFVMGDKRLIEALFAVKDSFNSYPVNTLSQSIGEIAINDEAYFRKTTKEIIAVRDFFSSALRQLGWHVLPSEANFVFAKKEGVTGEEIYNRLKQKGILVRYFDVEGINNFVRITIGTKEAMNRLLTEVQELF